MKLIKLDIEFKINKKKVAFSIIHNLPEVHGMSIEDALDNWLARTEEFTAKSLADYVNSKNTGSLIMTEEEYKKLLKDKQ